MTPEAAAWIRRVVLARHDAATLHALVDVCPCEYGLPDHCKPGGKHALCAHHGRHPGYPTPCPDTYLTLPSGRSRTAVWRAVGPPCIWRCPCEVCAAPPAVADEQLSLFDLAGAR